MSECSAAQPPLYRVDPRRATACYLHQEAPVIAGEEINQLFV